MNRRLVKEILKTYLTTLSAIVVMGGEVYGASLCRSYSNLDENIDQTPGDVLISGKCPRGDFCKEKRTEADADCKKTSQQRRTNCENNVVPKCTVSTDEFTTFTEECKETKANGSVNHLINCEYKCTLTCSRVGPPTSSLADRQPTEELSNDSNFSYIE